MKLGFTGPRFIVPDDPRLETLKAYLTDPDIEIFHHGDCVGWDAYAHSIVLATGKPIVVHPPIDEKYRAFCAGPEGQVLVAEPRPYLWRNGDIVRASFKMVAVVATPQEVLRSGTWATIRRARAHGMTEENGRLVILRP
jgi:hypothetical protein